MRKYTIRNEELNNLNKIPVIEERTSRIQSDITEIKTGIQAFNGVKLQVEKNRTNIGWLRGWHNKIVLGILLAFSVGIVTWIVTVIRNG